MSKIQDAWIAYQFALKNGYSDSDINICIDNLNKMVRSYIDNLGRTREEDTSWREEFEFFWESYDKRVGRKNAESAWKKLTKAEQRMALSRVKDYVASTPTVKYRKNPATWLNASGWEDQLKFDKPKATAPTYSGKRDDLFQ